MNLKYLPVKFDYWIKQTIINLLSRILFHPFHPSKAKKILIFRTGSMGDSICSLPAIQTIRQNLPDAHITILYNAGGNNLASLEHLIDHSIVDDFINYAGIPIKQVYKNLQKEKYDTFIEFPQVHQPFKSYIRNILFAKAIKVKYGIGWKIAATRLFPQIQEKNHAFIPVREFFMSILKDHNVEIPFEKTYALNISEKDREVVKALLSEGKRETRLIAVVVGAKRSQNRWPVENFDKVIQFLLALDNTSILLIGGKEDTAIAKQLETYNFCIDLTGKLIPMESAAALERCQITVTNDTGPMHLAYAAGSFVFAIFSSRDYPNLWYPPPDKSVVFRNNTVHCSACFTETCTNNICMQGIRPEQVIQAIQEKMEKD